MPYLNHVSSGSELQSKEKSNELIPTAPVVTPTQPTHVGGPFQVSLESHLHRGRGSIKDQSLSKPDKIYLKLSKELL
jgi:hypothetical protein